jgi:hypothetical protein
MLPVDVVYQGQSWPDVVRKDIAGCNIQIANLVLDHLFATARSRPGTGHLFRGLPGTGKTTVASKIIDALGLTYLPEPSSVEEREGFKVEMTIKRQQHQVDVGRMVGNPYVGDASAAFNALFDRAYGVCGVWIVNFDEVDLTATRDKENREQVGKWLDRFTDANKPRGLHILSSTNNDRLIVGAIRSRYSGGRIVVVPVAKYSQLWRTFESFCANRTTHPFMTLSERVLDAPTVARMALGLASRDIFVKEGSAKSKHEAMGNVFATGQQECWTPVEIALNPVRERMSDQAKILRDFLMASVANSQRIITGRVVICVREVNSVIVEVECFPRPSAFPLQGTAYSHTVQAGSLTRSYELQSLKEAYAIFQDVAVFIDAHHYQYVSSEFIDYIVGAVETSDRDEKYSVAFELIRSFCVAPGSSVIVIPMTLLGISVDDTTVAPQLHLAAASVFDAAGHFVCATEPRASISGDPDQRKMNFCVLVAANDNELRLVEGKSTPPFRRSSRMAVLWASPTTFTCALCGRDEVDVNATGCFHQPEDGAPFLKCRLIRKQKVPEWDKQQYYLRQLVTERSKDIQKVRIVGCGCEGSLIDFFTLPLATEEHKGPMLTKCQNGSSHESAKCKVLREVSKDVATEEALATVALGLAEEDSATVLCRYHCIISSGDKYKYDCAARHVRPDEDHFYVPPLERRIPPCKDCNHLAPTCAVCGRLIPNSPTRNRLFMSELNGVNQFYWCLAGTLRGFTSEQELLRLIDVPDALAAARQAVTFHFSTDKGVEMSPMCQPFPIGDPLPPTDLGEGTKHISIIPSQAKAAVSHILQVGKVFFELSADDQRALQLKPSGHTMTSKPTSLRKL